MERLFSYAPESYIALLADYNTAIWPNQWFAIAFVAVILLSAKRGGQMNGRWAIGILAGFWAWTCYKFHFEAFAPLNFLAPYYAGVFGAQAALLGYWAVRGSFDITLGFQPRILMGLNLLFLAVALHPLLTIAAGLPVGALQSVGVTPMPTVLVTIATFALIRPRPPLWLFVIPLLWSVWEGLTAYTLGLSHDMVLPVIAVIATLVLARPLPPQPLPEADG